MSYGRLTSVQLETLMPFVLGRQVYDLGAGNLVLARLLLNLGASSVVAIDKERPLCTPPSLPRNLDVVYTTFDKFHALPTTCVAFVSWPDNRTDKGLLRLVRRASQVVYLGKNTDGTACGSLALFEHFLEREILATEPDRKNTLIVYGARQDTRREPLCEERAGMSPDTILSYGAP
jgi:hypothetical protein